METAHEDTIDQKKLEVKYNTEVQPARRQKHSKQAPQVNKQFFEEVDEASSLLKIVLRENMDRRERQQQQEQQKESKLQAEEFELETHDDSKENT